MDRRLNDEAWCLIVRLHDIRGVIEELCEAVARECNAQYERNRTADAAYKALSADLSVRTRDEAAYMRMHSECVAARNAWQTGERTIESLRDKVRAAANERGVLREKLHALLEV